MAFAFPQFIFGYHGCDRAIGESILLGKKKINPSKNSYDWLGSGVYFWENAPERAWDWANFCVKHPKACKGRIKEPFVLGAIITLGNCLNLTEVSDMELLREVYVNLKEKSAKLGQPLPCNKNTDHKLDCLVINTAVSLNMENNHAPFDTVRGAYIEGSPIFEGSTLYDRTHIQVCVRNLDCIKGFFMPASR